MKLIYSYIPYYYTKGKSLDYFTVLTLYLSVIQSRKFYNEVILYTNEGIKNQIEKLGIPFTHIDTELLKDENAACPSIPKIKVYKEQTKPFIHIDADTILFSPLIGNPNLPVTFAHLDLTPNQLQLMPIEKLDLVFKAYVLPFYDKIFPPYYEDIKLESIPNMNIVYCKDTTKFSFVLEKVLHLYKTHKKYFDEDYIRFCTIEQLAIHAELITNLNNYKKSCNKNEHVLHQTEGFSFQDYEPFTAEIKNIFGKRVIKTKTGDDLIEKLVDENFGGYLHLSGDKKTHPLIVELVKRILSKNDPNIVPKINKHFKIISQNQSIL